MRKHFKAEEIVALLQEAEVDTESVSEFCWRKAISEKTFYRWRKVYGELQVDESKRLKALEAENAKLKKLLGEVLLATDEVKEILSQK